MVSAGKMANLQWGLTCVAENGFSEAAFVIVFGSFMPNGADFRRELLNVSACSERVEAHSVPISCLPRAITLSSKQFCLMPH